MGTFVVEPPDVMGQPGAGDGTQQHPFQSIGEAIKHAAEHGGGIVAVRAGHYVESIVLADIDASILITPESDHDEVYVDACIPEFLRAPGLPSAVWELEDASGGGVYRSVSRFDPPGGDPSGGQVRSGAFYDAMQHTRLVSYARREDLVASHTVWTDDDIHANRVWRELPKEHRGDPRRFAPQDDPNRPWYRPWVYMGPGIWFGETAVGHTGPSRGDRRVHMRLGSTDNGVQGWPDFDPGRLDLPHLRLALSRAQQRAVFLTGCQHVTFDRLHLRFGDEETVRLVGCTDIGFKRCTIWAASRAVYLLGRNSQGDDLPNDDIRFEDCVIDGGLPTWFFRSDRKDTYFLGEDITEATRIQQIVHDRDVGLAAVEDGVAQPGEVEEAGLGYSTSGVLVSGEGVNTGIVISYCEIVNGHDSYLFGEGMQFHHNWVNNLNDDGLAMSALGGTKGVEVYGNVVTQCLTALSFTNKVGPVYIYGNLFDCRRPTLGTRPADHDNPVPDSMRQGHFFKDGVDEGPIHLFHNTCLVLDPGATGADFSGVTLSGFSYFQGLEGSLPRTMHNNILVAAYTSKVGAVAHLAPGTFDCKTNGNTFFRIAVDQHAASAVDVFRVDYRNHPLDAGTFSTLQEYWDRYWPTDGDKYEADSVLADPLFHSFDVATGHPGRHDDLRLRSRADSPTKGKAVSMPHELTQKFSSLAEGHTADRGCYPSTGALMRVGVGGRRWFPFRPPRPGSATHAPPPLPEARD